MVADRIRRVNAGHHWTRAARCPDALAESPDSSVRIPPVGEPRTVREVAHGVRDRKRVFPKASRDLLWAGAIAHNDTMTVGADRNPFQRGAGSYPPILAGRDAELAALGRLLAGLADGSLRQTIHLVQAPRGLGKTVLLQALERDAADIGGVEVLRLSAGSFPALAELSRLVANALPWWRALPAWFAGLHLFGLRIQRPTDDAAAHMSLERMLSMRSSSPLLLAIDEAHVLPPDLCRLLLNVFQSLSGKVPCALLLVGTPALTPLLLSSAVNASFAERAPLIAPGLLSRDQSLQALQVPEWDGWNVDDATLRTVATDSLGYPFFVQLWGEQLWEAGIEGRTVDRQTLAAARKSVDETRDQFYAARFDEFERFAVDQGIDHHAVLRAVQEVAQPISEGHAIATRDLNNLIHTTGLTPEEAMLAKQYFVDNGFLDRTGDSWRAAIPSLAKYICEHPR